MAMKSYDMTSEADTGGGGHCQAIAGTCLERL